MVCYPQIIAMSYTCIVVLENTYHLGLMNCKLPINYDNTSFFSKYLVTLFVLLLVFHYQL